MKTFALDENHDIFLDEQGNIAMLEGQAQIAQDVATSCLVDLGEAEFDTERGVPYNQILGEPADMSLLQEYIDREAKRCDSDVLGATIINDRLDNENDRRLSFEIMVSTTEGVVNVV